MTDNVKIGARIGFLLSFAYSICMIIWRSLTGYDYLPVLILILLIALVISFFSAILGSITSVVFGLILKKYKNSLKTFTAICLFISILVVLPFNWLYFNWISTTESWNEIALEIKKDLFWILVPSSIIYIIASGFFSRYLFINNANEAGPTS